MYKYEFGPTVSNSVNDSILLKSLVKIKLANIGLKLYK